MNKISRAFENKKALIAYLTAGDPYLDKTKEYILAMAQSGADLIEIGIPFSDPVAEGTVIQSAMERALKNEINIDDIFHIAAQIEKEALPLSLPPLVFMTYLNPVLSYGYEKFFKKCKETGISGIIVPDMPFEEQDEIKTIANKNDIAVITLIAPTSNERISTLAKNAQGFIYLVSSLGVTGTRDKITTDIGAIVSQIRKETKIPIAVGFGISSPEQAKEMVKYADAAIIGSAIVKIISENNENTLKNLKDFVLSVKKELL
ncbi:MAG: tryptophan synthase subunit alpha [Elusimicrobiota bacterium]|jgi:tryptophan synthase alpha chain|nr:tryptophan synthase subunit alpha [Elusimicrobiota bacterium]